MNLYNVSGIYLIRNIQNGKFYVGSSVNIGHRWNCVHKVRLTRNSHANAHLQNAWNLYGANSFKIELLIECERDQLWKIEQLLLDMWVGVEWCYNISKNAFSPTRGLTFSLETRRKMSIRHKGAKNAFFGKSHSSETKLKIAAKRKDQIMAKGVECAISKYTESDIISIRKCLTKG